MVDIKAIEERLEKATPGPWLSEDDDAEIVEGVVATTVWENGVPVDAVIADCPRADDADLIAHAPEDIKDLLATVRELREAALEALAHAVTTHSLEHDNERKAEACHATAHFEMLGRRLAALPPVSPAPAKCSYCDGTGWVDVSLSFDTVANHREAIRCDHCDFGARPETEK